MTSNSGRTPYRIATAVAVAAGAVQVWMNLAVGIVGNEDNPVNQGFYGVVVTAMACAFVARFQAAGMARAMVAVAGVQALLALMLATAPSNARDAMAVIVLSSGFAALWLISAALFQRSARLSERG